MSEMSPMLVWSLTALISFGFLLAYTWVAYPCILWILRFAVRRPTQCAKTVPSITLILAVHDEEKRIAAKLEDCLALEYPQDLFEILVASDGSTDATERIVQEFAGQDSRVKLIRSPSRSGKSGVQNLAAEHARGEVLLFTDAETRTRPDLLRRIAENFADPRVGLVAPTVFFGKFGTVVSNGQGAYWRFELFLRQLESDTGILATASGSAFAIRRELFHPVARQYGDDCIIPLDIRLQNYYAVQDPRIIVYDDMPHTIDGELRARIRMTARNWSGILSRPAILNPLRFPGTAWGLVSHKFLRWMTPFFLAGMYLANCALALRGELVPLLALQTCFYLAAVVGWRRSGSRSCEPIFAYPFAFCLANLGFLLGLVKCARQQRIVAYR